MKPGSYLNFVDIVVDSFLTAFNFALRKLAECAELWNFYGGLKFVKK